MVTVDSEKLKLRISQAASDLGFDLCRITSADMPQGASDNLRKYLSRDYHGSMDWMVETQVRRSSPRQLWPQTRSVIVLAMNYGPDQDPLEGLKFKDSGVISVYARNRDYHDIIKGKLKTLAGKLVSWHPCDVKVFVDTAPVMEKPLAALSGLGWQGKHTNLVSREFGSWLFLGSIFTSIELPPDGGEEDHCGNCSACLDICPTGAFPAPYQIDARRCISYLTIENKGPIPLEFRRSIGNRIYGCDDCLAICPWNKFARTANEAKLSARDDLNRPTLLFLLGLDDPAFRKFFSGSPIKRIGRDCFMRNVLIATGNSGNNADNDIIDRLIAHLKDPNPLVRGAAIWALRMVGDKKLIARLRDIFFVQEKDDNVRSEWSCDLDDK